MWLSQKGTWKRGKWYFWQICWFRYYFWVLLCNKTFKPISCQKQHYLCQSCARNTSRPTICISIWAIFSEKSISGLV